MKKLTNEDFCRAAKRLKCKVAAVKAVSEVESRGEGFYTNGFPVILFERHKFKKYTNGKYNKTHPHLSGPAGNYGSAGQNQRNKFNEAFALNPEAAMLSCSWGKFQIMGFNYEVCGYKSVGAFVDAMKESEGKQLDAFVSFVISNGLDKHLRNLNWSAFASGYNGSGYKKNKYDTKMASAFVKFEKEGLDCAELVKKTVSNEPIVEKLGEVLTEPNELAEELKEVAKDVENVNINVNTPPKIETPTVTLDRPVVVEKEEPKGTSGWGAWVSNIRAQVAAAGIGVPALGSLAFITNPTFWYVVAGIVVFAALVSLTVYIASMHIKSKEKRERERFAHEETLKKMEIYADPTKYNVTLK